MKSDNFHWHLCLQRFGEGGAAAGADSGGTAPVAGEQNGGDGPSFDEMLASNPRYQEEHERRSKERVDKAIKGRFKAQEEREGKLRGIFEVLGDKYGLQAGEDGSYDIDAMLNAVNGDESIYEDEALERGLSVEQLKAEKAKDREYQRLKAAEERRLEDEHKRQLFDKVAQQTAEAKKIYPGLDIDAELQNPQFQRLIWSGGVDVRTAYEVVHRDEIMTGAMAYATEETKAAVAANLAAGRGRPREGAAGGTPGVSMALDPRNLTKEQRKNLKQRVLGRGERFNPFG